ncbi:acetyl-CoA C-acyltransferase [Psychromonas sp. psych-6C06]|uniref:thiolase family protein n=1 Tax=Psychromonas sp. psych-6C06 TaxID=2058089 RepID=UPI000C334125|nr:thiolase family protein [Psychromonas sp. psych-6C06]PKF60581.1 acetyl-CoA C-acyltransferase [Psychromonas sp. psych-6C06]
MKERLAIVEGIRTPFCRAGSEMAGIAPDDLAAVIVKELLAKTNVDINLIDELIMGNVGQPSNACNIARVIALKAGLPEHLIAYTVHRNCASGMQSITTGYEKMLAGNGEIVIAGGTESMSQYPLKFGSKMTQLFADLMKAKTTPQKLTTLSQFRPHFLKPVISIVEGLTDPICGLNMGQTAEVLAREFSLSRSEQDTFALNSHLKAAKAQQSGFFEQEIHPILLPPHYNKVQQQDNAIRTDQSIEKLAKLRPFFDRAAGTITVANACPITDGAGAVLIMLESKAKALGYQPLGYLKDYAYAGLSPDRMGLGPVYATSKLLDKSGMSMSDFDLIELNEAFAAQVIANQRAFESALFSQTYLNKDKALGPIDDEKLNVHGGAIALGHPVGATGTRLVITMLKALRSKKQNSGLVTLCIGGGQGAALALEVE